MLLCPTKSSCPLRPSTEEIRGPTGGPLQVDDNLGGVGGGAGGADSGGAKGEEEQEEEGGGGISAPLVLSQERMKEVYSRLQRLEQRLRGLQVCVRARVRVQTLY